MGVFEGGEEILPWYANEVNVNFMINFDGFMHVMAGGNGTYEFKMECHGSCRLKIDNMPLIDAINVNAGRRGGGGDSGGGNNLTLSSGWHRIQVFHANRVGRWAYTRTLNNNDRTL